MHFEPFSTLFCLCYAVYGGKIGSQGLLLTCRYKVQIKGTQHYYSITPVRKQYWLWMNNTLLQTRQIKGGKGRQLEEPFPSSHPFWLIVSGAFYHSHHRWWQSDVVCCSNLQNCTSTQKMTSSWSSLSENQTIPHVFMSINEIMDSFSRDWFLWVRTVWKSF